MKHYAVFSEAIREGAKLRPQAISGLRLNGGSCAFGAGLEALGIDVPEFMGISEVFSLYARAEDQYTYLRNRHVGCPKHCESWARENLTNLIWHLNDHHKWTREQIADWLSTEEENLGFVLLSEEEPKCLPIIERELQTLGV